jgi:hypothetical protein
VLVVLALLGVGLPARAEAATPACGGHITADTTLDHDLIGCRDGGLTVAEGVTLDLGGHTVAGLGEGDGIALRDGAVLRNGTVTGYSTGVRAGRAVVEDVVAFANSFQGVKLEGPATVRRVDASGNASWGLRMTDAVHAEVLDSRFTGNSTGAFAWFSGGARFEGNTFSDNRGNGLETDESPSVVIGNTASHNGAGGIVIDDQWPEGSNYTIASNRADGNGALGISFTGLPRFGFSTVDGGGNSASGNGDPRQCVQVACPAAPAPQLGPLPARLELTAADPLGVIPVANLGGGQLEYTAVSDRGWLEVQAPRIAPRMAPSNVFVLAHPEGMGRGEHRANVTITPLKAGPSRRVKVALTVLAPPQLRLSASALPITLPARAVVPRTRIVRVRNGGDGELAWTARTNRSWVTVTPDRGAAPSALTVRIAPKGLAPGTHTATVRVHPLDQAAPDRTIAVTLQLIP